MRTGQRAGVSRLLRWVSVSLAVVAYPGAAAAAPRTLTLGFTDPVFMENVAAPEWLTRVTDSAGGIVRLDALWRDLAPTKPTDGADPEDPAYRWAPLDTAIKQAAGMGVEIVVTIERAPTWAEGPDRPKDAMGGSWRPDPSAFGRLGQALATRYSGSHPDPAVPGTSLPAVRYLQAWNEPNLSSHYEPQWVKGANGLVRYAPRGYRSLLNHFYGGVKSGSSSTQVVAAGLAPFGDYVRGGDRTPPAAFWREVFCFRDSRLQLARCPNPARFDVFDHHPYSVGSPTRKALNVDDVTIPDLTKLTRPLRRAEQTGRALPRKRHRIWASEVSWDSNPPDPDGVPERTRAAWIPQTFELLWRQGVDTVFWFLIRDTQPTPSYAATYQSGMYLNDGTAKLGQQAFRLPVSRHRRKGVVTIWARFPAAGTLVVERNEGSGWREIATQGGDIGDVLDRRFRARGRTTFRVRFDAAS